MSLSAATKQLLGVEYYVRVGPLWTFNGRLLSEMYEETYGDGE